MSAPRRGREAEIRYELAPVSGPFTFNSNAGEIEIAAGEGCQCIRRIVLMGGQIVETTVVALIGTGGCQASPTAECMNLRDYLNDGGELDVCMEWRR